MVATRRMVQKDPAEDELAADPDLALKKKPVRKATAKTATAKTETKTKTTRGKKADVQPEDQQMELDDQLAEVEEVETTRTTAGRPKKDAAAKAVTADLKAENAKTTKAGSLRGKKAVTITDEASAAKESDNSKSTRSTKAGSVRGRKAKEAAEEALAPASNEEPKPVRAAKGGSVRGRKAAAAVEAEAPLMEKETKPTRSTKSGSVRGRKAAAVVDEVPDLPAPEPKKTRQTRTTAKAQPLSPKKITQVSQPARTTRNANQKPSAKAGTTKTPAPKRGTIRKRTVSDENAEVPELQGGLLQDDDVVMESSTPVKTRATRSQPDKCENAVDSELSISSRPTTPTDSTTQSFSRIENENDEDEDEETEDANSVSNVGPTDGAEQDASQDELCGPKTPMKRASPGTEARYRSSAQRTIRKNEDTVRMQTPARRFAVLGSQRGTPQTQKPYCKPVPPSSDVRPMTVARGTERAFVFKDLQDGAPSPGVQENDLSEQDELSFIPDEDIIPLDEDVPMAEAPAAAAPIQAQSPSVSNVEEDENTSAGIAFTHFVDDEAGFVAPADVEGDPDETVLVHNPEDVPSPDVQPAESFETEDTVLVTRPDEVSDNEHMSRDETEDDTDSVVIHEADVPTSMESIDWQAAEDAPITVNFNDLFSRTRTPAKGEPYEQYQSEMFSTPSVHEGDAVAGIEIDLDLEPVTQDQTSRRQTFDLNGLFNVGPISEPTRSLDMPDAPWKDGHEEPPTLGSDPTQVGFSMAELVVEETADNKASDELEDVDMLDATPAPLELTQDCNDNPIPADQEEKVPHYALPTIAFDARRKSLPVLSLRTPTKLNQRPNTSDGASMPRIMNSFAEAWWSRSRASSIATTPLKTRPSTAHATPTVSSPYKSPAKSPGARTPIATPKERFPRLAPRQDYEAHAKTVAAPRTQTPSEKPIKRRETFHKAISGRAATPKADESVATTPVATKVDETPQVTPGERYPRLRPRTEYEEHAKTVAAPVRFQTPVKTPLKRPATTQKPESLRKAALKNTPMGTHTCKTPLKAAAMTPGQEPMTPHPAAPLRGVLALVEVFTLEGASASAPFVALLHRLGSKTTRTWSDRVTHVIFKDGSPTTLQRVRLNNKEVEEKGTGAYIHCVNSRWVNDCDTEGTRMDESEEVYAVDVAEVPRGGKRRRKSMEPSALLNIGGNIVRDRKSSFGRTSSLSRSPLKFDSPAKQPGGPTESTPQIDVVMDKENSGDDQSSPATPAWIAEPGKLVQQTAPMNRVRKLEMPGKEAAKNRRLTFWNGGS